MKRTFSLFSLLLIMLLTSSPLFAKVEVNATVSDNSVVLGDIFMLTVSINDNDDDYQLDTRSMEEDFTVYRPARSQSSTFVNGDFNQKTQWQVRLQAKKTGTLTIPSFAIGNLKTNPIDIKVTQASKQPQKAHDSTVFIENSMDKDNVYVGQSFIFTSKLFISQNSIELDLLAPSFQGSEVTVAAQDHNSQTVRNGIRYNTITRQYKMIATEAGQFEIDSPLLTGTLRKVVAVSEWQNKVIADPINVRGERLSINVKAIPEDFKGKWIVSEDLRLFEENDLTAQSYKVGEPITRSIKLQIASVGKDKLPNIELNYPKSLRVYPDQDQLDEGQANGLTYGMRVIRHAIIAEEEGELTLPEVRFDWFNSQTNQQETAILPAQTLTIVAADKVQVNNEPVIQPTTKPVETTIIVDNAALIYWQICVAVLLVIILFMVFYHLAYRRSITANKQIKKATSATLNQHAMALKSSFTQKNPTECYKALLNYALHEYPALKSLNQFADKTNLSETDKQQLNNEIQKLEKCCSEKGLAWDATQLAMLIKKHESNKNSRQNVDPMNLNP